MLRNTGIGWYGIEASSQIQYKWFVWSHGQRLCEDVRIFRRKYENDITSWAYLELRRVDINDETTGWKEFIVEIKQSST